MIVGTVPWSAVSVYGPAVPVMLQPVKTASPAAVARVFPPLHARVAPADSVKVMLFRVVTVFPETSSTVTVGDVGQFVVLATPLTGRTVYTMCVAALAALITTLPLFPAIAAVSRACNVYVASGPVSAQPANDATPADATTVSVLVHVRLVLAGVPVIDNVTDVGAVTVLLLTSFTVAVGELVNVAPLTPVTTGALVKSMWVAAPAAEMITLLLKPVTDAVSVAVSVYVASGPVNAQRSNAATPALATTWLFVHEMLLPAGVPVTLKSIAVNAETVFPPASSTVAMGLTVKRALLAPVATGSVVKPICTAGPTVMVAEVEAGVSEPDSACSV